MKLTTKLGLITLVFVGLQGCNPFESTFDKQVSACTSDIKLGLGDPSSLEVVSTEEINLDGGGYRINVLFTAKNAMGGRVRGKALCGFESKKDVELNAEDIFNQNRKLARDLREMGIR